MKGHLIFTYTFLYQCDILNCYSQYDSFVWPVLKSVCLRLRKVHLCLHGCDACRMLGYILHFFHGCCACACKLQHCISSDPENMSLYMFFRGVVSCHMVIGARCFEIETW